MRDRKDNAVVICSIENIDPMGVHTGDSITVAPIQTLSDREYQTMRTAAIDVLRAVGVDCGGSNVQFAVHPSSGRMTVIEMNPRVSRSSALASKATGFPIARAAARLAVGYTLDEIPNEITGENYRLFRAGAGLCGREVSQVRDGQVPGGIRPARDPDEVRRGIPRPRAHLHGGREQGRQGFGTGLRRHSRAFHGVRRPRCHADDVPPEKTFRRLHGAEAGRAAVPEGAGGKNGLRSLVPLPDG